MQMSEQLANPQSIRQDFAIPGRVMLHTLSEALNNRRQQLAELGCRKKIFLEFLMQICVYLCNTFLRKFCLSHLFSVPTDTIAIL
jgi:hypothetical protein